MTSTSEALIELRKGLRIFRAFEHAEKAISVLEGLEQNEREIRARIEAANAELATLDARTEERLAEFEKLIGAAKERAQKARDDLAAAESATLAEANTQAAAIIDAARKAADEAAKEASSALKAVAAAKADVAAKKQELSALQEQVDALRAQAAKIFK